MQNEQQTSRLKPPPIFCHAPRPLPIEYSPTPGGKIEDVLPTFLVVIHRFQIEVDLLVVLDDSRAWFPYAIFPQLQRLVCDSDVVLRNKITAAGKHPCHTDYTVGNGQVGCLSH